MDIIDLMIVIFVVSLIFSGIDKQMEHEQKVAEKRNAEFVQNQKQNKLNDVKCYNHVQWIFVDSIPTYVIKDPKSNSEVSC
jgi:hypothetical protein